MGFLPEWGASQIVTRVTIQELRCPRLSVSASVSRQLLHNEQPQESSGSKRIMVLATSLMFYLKWPRQEPLASPNRHWSHQHQIRKSHPLLEKSLGRKDKCKKNKERKRVHWRYPCCTPPSITSAHRYIWMRRGTMALFPVVPCHAFGMWHWPIGKDLDLSFIWGHYLHLAGIWISVDQLITS